MPQDNKKRKYQIVGVKDPQQEARLQRMLAYLDVPKLNALIFIPDLQFKTMSDNLRMGRSFGQAFSLLPAGRTYMPQSLLDKPGVLDALLAHEAGHYASGDTNEDAGREWVKHYQQQIDQFHTIQKQEEDFFRYLGQYITNASQQSTTPLTPMQPPAADAQQPNETQEQPELRSLLSSRRGK